MYFATLRLGSLPLLAVAMASLLVACSPNEPQAEPIRAVRTMTVGADSAGGSQEFAAEVRARVESRLGFRVGGKMTSRAVEVGQHVRAAQTNYDLAAAEFKRYQELRQQGFISSLELERRETTLKAQKAQLDQALAQGGVQGNQAGYAALLAPSAGVVTLVEAEAGAVVAAGTPVLRLAHDGPRDAVFTVPEDGVAAMRALLGKPGALKVRPWGAQATLPATVREVAAAADATTRTFLVKADIGNAPLQLGQTLTAVVDLPRREGITRLPLSAVMQQQGQTAVWLLDKAAMTVKVQPIAVAGADGNAVIVGAGLSPGQTVVTAGVHLLTPGQKVKLYQPPVALAASAAAASR